MTRRPPTDPASTASQDLIALIRQPASAQTWSLPEWDRILRLARASNVLGRLARALQQNEAQAPLPPQVLFHLVSIDRLTNHQREALAWECNHLQDALQGLQIPLVLLKGAAYAKAGLQAAHGRLFGDIDLLVPRAAIQQVEQTLMMHGWVRDQMDPYDVRYYREWMHELPPMRNLVRGTVIDLHHNILPPSTGHAPDPALLIAASLPLCDGPFRRLADTDLFIHSATHLFYESELKNGLRDLLDLDALLREFGAGSDAFWAALLARAATLGLNQPVALALHCCARLAGTPVPEPVRLQALLAAGLPGWRITLLEALYRRALSPHHELVDTWPVRLSRWCLYVRGHALRMPAGRLSLHLARKAWWRMFKSSSRKI